MGKYKVTTDDGRSYIVETEDAAPPKQETPVTAENILSPVMQGLTFGFADELAPIVSGAADVFKGKLPFTNYDRDKKQLRDLQHQTEKDHPWLNLAGQVVGSLPTALVPGLNMARGGSLAQTARAAISAGAKAGALSGAGAAEGGLADRAWGAAKGAVAGTLVGAGVPVAGRVLGRTGQVVADAFADTPIGKWVGRLPGVTPPGPQRGVEKVAEAFSKDVPLQQAEARIGEYSVGGKPVVLADVGGENVRGLADAGMLRPNSARSGVMDQLVQRAEDAGQRVVKDAIDTTGLRGDATAVAKALAAKRAADAAPLYQQVYQEGDVPISDPEILRILQKPVISEAYARAKKIASTYDVELPELLGPNGELRVRPNLQVLDYVKRGLDDLLYAGKRSLGADAPGKWELNGVAELRRKLVDRLDEAFPGYAKARAAWAGPTRMAEAIEDGRKFSSMDPSDIDDLLKSEYTSPAERESFLLGAVDAIKRSVAGMADGADAYKLIFGKLERRQRLQALFPSKESFEEFAKRMTAERQMRITNDAIRGNSRTALRLFNAMDSEDNSMVTAIPQLLQGNFLGPITQAVGSRLKGNVGLNAEYTLPLLFGDPRKGLEVVRAAQKSLARRAATPVRSAAPLGTISGLLTGN